ncbi:MAG: hypothetical protein RBS34_16235 [Desulfofustis sp.]|jgi:hypothetical protein|nr:hypothetical protein [Desulfofustis sp.]
MAEKRIIATEIEYEPLSEEERFTEEEQIDQCCEPVSVDECADVGRVSPFISRDQEEWDFDPDEIAAGYAKTYGDKFLGYELHQVGPKGNCGEKHETWQDRLNCCEDVAPLVYDTDSSVSVLAPGTHGNVYFTGGRFPVLVKVRGNGFTLDGYNQRDGWIDGPGRGFTIYAHEFACGTAPITLDDGCSVTHGSVRSTSGRWVGDCYAYSYSDSGLFPPENRRCNYLTQAGCVYSYTGLTTAFAYRENVRLISYRWAHEDGDYWQAVSAIDGRPMVADAALEEARAFILGYGFGPQNPNDYWPDGPVDGCMCGSIDWVC